MEAMTQVWPSGIEAFLVDIRGNNRRTICTGFFFMEKVFLTSDECMLRRHNDKARLNSNIHSYNFDFTINTTDRIIIPCVQGVVQLTLLTLHHPVKVFVSTPR